MIRNLAVVLVILTSSTLISARGDGEEYVAIPSEFILLTIASPPGCPVQFENGRLLMNVQEKSYAFTYDIRNVSAKPIAHWQPMFWTSLGTGGTLISESESRQKNQVLLPGEVFHEAPPRLVPLTQDLKKRLNLDTARREMVILVMSDVVFQDGSRYENRSFVNSITSYFEQLSTDLNRLENITKDYEKRKPR